MNNTVKIELFNDNFQNYKRYGIPKAQLVIADIPYNIGTNFYGSNPMWYVGGDNKNGESKKAGKERWRDRATRTTTAPTYFKYIDKQEDKNKMTKEQRRRNEMPPVIIRGGKHRIRAAELLGKRYGLYRDRIEIEFEGELKINVDYEEDAQ